jgi:recombinational DNA repair ATPase RecF
MEEFSSTGASFTEINFTKSPNLIVGQNGAGKSQFWMHFVLVCLVKPFRKINKPQLLNSINGRRAYFWK